MAGQCSAMFGWSWTDVSVLGSQVFGQALMDSCDRHTYGRTDKHRGSMTDPAHRAESVKKEGKQTFDPPWLFPYVVLTNRPVADSTSSIQPPIGACRESSYGQSNPIMSAKKHIWARTWTLPLHTANCKLHTAHCKLHTAHCKPHTEHCILHTAHCTLNTSQ